MMIILSAISLIGLICAATMHLAALARIDWVAGHATTLFEVLAVLGVVLLLITVVHAWDWSLGGFWDNLTDGMPWLARTLIFVTIIYPCAINGLVGSRRVNVYYAYQSMHPEYYTSLLHAWLMSSVLLPLFFLPMMYFWKERAE